MEERYLLIIIDVILYSASFIYYWSRIKRMNVGLFILLITAISHIGMIPYFFILKNIGSYEILNLSLVPFVFLYLMIILGLHPFIIRKRILKADMGRNERILFHFSVLIIIIAIEPLLENVILYFTSHHVYSDIYDEKRSEELNIYSDIGGRLMNITRYVTVLSTILLFYYLSNFKKNKYIILGLSIVQLNYFLNAINTASRGAIVSQMFMCILCFLIFYNTYSKKLLTKIKKYSPLLLIPFFLFLYSISVSRYDSSKKTTRNFDGFILLYLSEGPLKFNSQMWDGNHNTNGDVNLNFFKYLLGYDTYTTYESRDEHYTRINGRRIEQFYTYVGDFVSDFGVFGAFVVCVLLFFLSRKLLGRDKQIPFHNIIIIVLILHMYSIGFTSNLYRAFFFQKCLLVMTIVFFFLKYNYKRKSIMYKNER